MSWTRFTLTELTKICQIIDRVKPQLTYPIADPRDYEMRWADDLTDGVLAKYNQYKKHLFYVSNSSHGMLEHIYTVGAVVHELRHAWQLNELGFGAYVLVGCRLWAKYTTEPSAYQVQAEAEEIVQKW